MHEDVAIIIPSRLASQRLHQKPLEMIGSYTMIEHMVNQVRKTGLENIYVATDSELIADKALGCGGKYIMTRPDHPSGTDRVYEAFLALNNNTIEYVINVQGDMPFVDPTTILKVIEHLKHKNYKIITPVIKVDLSAAEGASNVKVVVDHNDKALYFSRSLIPHNGSEFLYHVGIYGFQKDILKKFVELPTSKLEQIEKLEQLRALENNIDIGICYVDNIPISIDTKEDLEKAREFYNINYDN